MGKFGSAKIQNKPLSKFATRVYRICSNEIQAITNLPKKNVYPGWITRNTTQKFLGKQHDIDKNLNKSDQSTKKI